MSQEQAELVEILRQMIMIREFDLLAIELATRSEAEITERAGVKWISPSQTQSMPQASAMSASSNASSNAETAVAPRRISSTKSPKCMRRLYHAGPLPGPGTESGLH